MANCIAETTSISSCTCLCFRYWEECSKILKALGSGRQKPKPLCGEAWIFLLKVIGQNFSLTVSRVRVQDIIFSRTESTDKLWQFPEQGNRITGGHPVQGGRKITLVKCVLQHHSFSLKSQCSDFKPLDKSIIGCGGGPTTPSSPQGFFLFCLFCFGPDSGALGLHMAPYSGITLGSSGDYMGSWELTPGCSMLDKYPTQYIVTPAPWINLLLLRHTVVIQFPSGDP